VAGTIRLREYATFGLFADAVASADASDDADDADAHAAHTAHVALAETELICDVLQDLKGPRRTPRDEVEETSERARNPFKTFKTGKDVPGTEERTDEEKNAHFGRAPFGAPRLVFKKRMFRDTDESVTEPVFVSLSYLQLKRDFLDGRYPVNAADAAQLCALQIQAEDGPRLGQKEPIKALVDALPRFVPPHVLSRSASRSVDRELIASDVRWRATPRRRRARVF
jgi:hypothetical protein